MALASTATLRKGNIELSTTELVAIIDELQTKVTALATLATANKAAINATLAQIDADNGTIGTDYVAENEVEAADVTV